jgi:hypothetical protein
LVKIPGENEKLTSKVLKLGLAQIWLKEGFQLLLVRKRFDGKTTKIKKIIYLFKMAVGLHFIYKTIFYDAYSSIYIQSILML